MKKWSPPVQLLRELVALPSVNPAFADGREAWTGEKRVADFLAAVGAKAGLEVDLVEAAPDRPNVTIRLEPSGSVRHRVILAPHTDTVVVDDESGFDPRISRGRLHGRGACDTKGSIAAMLSAVIRLVDGGRRPAHTEVLFAGLVDEEHGQIGSRAFAAGGIRADLAIVGEPTRLQLVTAHKGDVWLRLTTRGLAAHGATPHLGRNAIHDMAKLVNLVEGKYARQLRRKKHPLLGRPTVNVGTIHGGTQPNIVPDHCGIEIDRRLLPGETETGVRRELRALLRANGFPASSRIETLRTGVCPAMDTDPDRPLVRRMLDLLGQARPIGVDYFCDAAVLSRAGTPSVVFGPGDIAQAHTANEWIDIRSLEQGADFLARFLETLP